MNTNWPPAGCPNPALPVNTSTWAPLNVFSFPYDALDHGYGSTKLTKAQVYGILSMVWAIENSESSLDGVVPWFHAYPYIQNIGDGRGYTTNIVGFCSGTGDFPIFLANLQKYEPCNPLVKYLPDVQALSAAQSGKLTGLLGLPYLVLEQGGGPKGEGLVNPNYVRAAWDTLLGNSDSSYWKTAMDYSRQFHLSLPISKGQLYDIGLNAGTVGLSTLLQEVKVAPPTAAESGGPAEIKWLLALQERWVNRLKTVEDIDGFQTDRGMMWQHLVDPKNNTLNSHNQVGANNVDVNLDFTFPISINCYGHTINIRAPPADSSATTTTTTTTTTRPITSATSISTKATTTTTTTTTAAPSTTPGSGCFPAWSSAAPYTGGAKVSYENVNYIAAWYADPSNIPGKGDPWRLSGPCGSVTTKSTTTTTTTTTTIPPTTTTATTATPPSKSTTTTTTTTIPVTSSKTTTTTTTTTKASTTSTTTASSSGPLGQPCAVFGSSQCVGGTMYACLGVTPYKWSVWYQGC
ncbi:glycosyl hydrolase family 46-domain-containing protein [Obelidium mucronatum]|nr:glycosyl hydrolase family 46-domain-containing protein [Obelidium mucronatum]